MRPVEFAAVALRSNSNMENSNVKEVVEVEESSNDDPSCTFLREFRNACATPVMTLRSIAHAMAAEMQAGLDCPGERRLKMLPTYLECLPTGKYVLAILSQDEAIAAC